MWWAQEAQEVSEIHKSPNQEDFEAEANDANEKASISENRAEDLETGGAQYENEGQETEGVHLDQS